MTIRTKMLIAFGVTLVLIVVAMLAEQIAVAKNERQLEASQTRYLSY
ncbi:hypothetical protein [Bowmanella dokdonensis]|uniref:Uncharacterized protein n=1 Tax=Bowmanella dokdonensis TaxID=751969 RepID=A0A939DTT1_9ALTE|nr:hypothetical protein [Bowmanella dokdonensis]MBN7827756.1 hypothetical protein [Bowmanella dokdonensis]